MSPRPVISILTDFGVRDPSGAICEGVILGICPDAIVVHVSHEVTKYAIRDGALMLWCAVPFMPVGVTSPWSIRGWAPLAGRWRWSPSAATS